MANGYKNYKRPALDIIDKNQGETNHKIAKLDTVKEGPKDVIGNPGIPHIAQKILQLLDQKSQLAFRQICKSWKAQIDQPLFWIKKLDLLEQSKNIHDSWIDLIGRIEKGSFLEKEVTNCLMAWSKDYSDYPEMQDMTPIFAAIISGHTSIVKFITSPSLK